MPETISGFEGMPLSVVRRTIRTTLSEAGFSEVEREARLLLQHATALMPEQLLLSDARLLTDGEAKSLADALTRRLAHEPLSRIRGERAFYGRAFEITPAVLDPRPETETLIDLVLQWADESGGRNRPLNIIDIGTGSGAMLITLLAELPRAMGLGTDVSPEALQVARNNAIRNAVAGRARFELAHALDGIVGPFDILVSNPPYIPSADVLTLEAAVRDYDPALALDGGPDGLRIYRQIAARAGAVVPSGLIALEVGAGQAADVSRILTENVENRRGAPWTRADLGGHDRTVALLTQC
ncbi:MAG: peptide chain release factor N(5)-glutamine methyltransferase [Hyphomicrobium sp.]|nr:peptide chain release factor N(5)-glutamine methyltransferase [Hyphomicrobium sp.]